ncbi:acyltransferase family protein [Ochrobactrum quorumnocens]|nr:acyltransferase [[Ochrobactrum] quorumnocens]
MKRTGYLDGLRGLAAFAVMLSHIEPLLVSAVTGTYAPSGMFAYTFYMLTSGSLAVAVFFMLSGFVLVLSYDKHEGHALANGAAKRYFRLAPPIVASMILTYILANTVGYYSIPAAELMGGHNWLSLQSPGELSFGRALVDGFTAPFLGSNPHNGVLWTMNIEFWGGLGLFGVASLFYKSKLYWLFVISFSALAVYIVGVNGMHFSLFLFGSLLLKYRQSWSSSKFAILIPFGLLLGVVRPWHGVMQSLQSFFMYSEGMAFNVQIALNSLGGALIVIAVVLSPSCQKILSKNTFKYLGELSFSLYLVHLPIFLTIGCFTFIKLEWLGLNLAAAGAALITIATSLIISDLLFRTADRFSVYLSNLVGRQVIGSFGAGKTETAATSDVQPALVQ